MTAAALDRLIRRFADRRVLVLGDMVADEYLMGRPARISREAPVLILHYSSGFVRPGGATNVAYNLNRLGAKTTIVGVVGDDEMGRRLRSVLDEAGIDTRCLLVDSARPTSTMTRVMARGAQGVQQHIVRIDRVDESGIPDGLRDRMVDEIRHVMHGLEALLVSDYEIGVISPELIDACLPEATRRGIKVVVDSHGDLFRFRGITAATPNQPEAAAAVGRSIETEEQLHWAGRTLQEGMNADGVLITRGSEGIALYERDRQPYALPVSVASESDVVDPTGAGDTVASVFTLALVAGGSMREAAYLGNLAGGEVVRRLGAATLTQDDLHRALRTTTLRPPE